MKLTKTQKKRTMISGALPPIAHTGILSFSGTKFHVPKGGLASQFFARQLTLTGRQLPAWTFCKRKASAKSIIVRCVSIFSDKMFMACDHEYEHDDNTTLHNTPTTTRPHNKGWRSATDATLPGHREHSCGSLQGHPRYTGARSRGGRGWRDNRLTK